MNLTYLHRQLKKRKEYKHYEIKPIGSAIRLRRKELKMTLEEGAEGICSISYLSKLENNQIDPNLDFVDKLVERFDLKEQIAFDIERYEKDIVELTELMLNLEKPKRSYIEAYRDREDHQARMIQLVETTLNESYREAMEHYKVVQQFIPHLRQSELALILLCVGESLLNQERYQDAYQMICEIPLAHKEIYVHYILALRIRLRLSFLMHKTADIDLYYHHYLTVVDGEGYDHLSKEIKLHYLMHLAHYQLPKEIKRIESTIDRMNQLEHLPYAISCFSHHRYDDVIEMTRTRKSLKGWLIIYLLSLEQKERYEELIHVITHRLEEKLSLAEETIVIHLRAKYMKSHKDLLYHLRRDIMIDRVKSDDPMMLEYIMMDSSRLFAKSQFYKEANQVVSLYQPHLKNLKIACANHEGEV